MLTDDCLVLFNEMASAAIRDAVGQNQQQGRIGPDGDRLLRRNSRDAALRSGRGPDRPRGGAGPCGILVMLLLGADLLGPLLRRGQEVLEYL